MRFTCFRGEGEVNESMGQCSGRMGRERGGRKGGGSRGVDFGGEVGWEWLFVLLGKGRGEDYDAEG